MKKASERIQPWKLTTTFHQNSQGRIRAKLADWDLLQGAITRKNLLQTGTSRGACGHSQALCPGELTLTMSTLKWSLHQTSNLSLRMLLIFSYFQTETEAIVQPAHCIQSLRCFPSSVQLSVDIAWSLLHCGLQVVLSCLLAPSFIFHC